MPDRVFDTPEAVEAAFYEAFVRIDLQLMEAVWADGEQALCIHPGSGLRKGKAAVMQSWMEVFTGSAPPAVEYRYVTGFASGNLVVRLVEERIRSRNKPPEAASRVLATNVYVRDAQSWRLTGHHASLPLVGRTETAGDGRQLH